MIRPSSPNFRFPSQRRGAIAAALLALTACGGGGTAASVGAPATASSLFASGPITGFGSVIVNGVRFDDSAAAIADDDGGTLTEAGLRLGMHCEIDGHAGDDHRGTARAILVRSALVGPVSAVDPVARTLTVLGQTVAVDAATAFDDAIAGGFTGLAAGAVVAVHAQFDASSQTYEATRVQLDAGAAQYKIRGTVTALDAAAKTLRIGAATIAYGSARGGLPALGVGSLIVARLDVAPVGGVWTATRVDDGRPAMHDQDKAELHGTITAFASAVSFSVDGTSVDASKANFSDGQAGLGLGARVEVEGDLVAGAVVATKVAIEDAPGRRGDANELHGLVGALDTAARTFVVRGTTVSYAGNVEFDDGTAASLANNVFVEVQGGLSADGTRVVATRIDLKPKD